jgi:hypothetical protein
LGKALGLIGITYLLYRLYQEYTLDSFFALFVDFLPLLPLLLLLNLLSLLIGIDVWGKMLRHYASSPVSYLLAFYYFSKTEVAKYLPGNIFHLLSRQALASSIGVTQKEMAKVSLLQALLLLTATMLASLLFALASAQLSLIEIGLLIGATTASMLLLLFAYRGFSVIQKLSFNLSLALSIALQGIILGLIIWYGDESLSLSLFFLSVAIYLISWLIGFVTPGASGGLGVREGAFIAIASAMSLPVAQEKVIFAILLVRIINIVVDVLLYLSTLMLETRIKENRL